MKKFIYSFIFLFFLFDTSSFASVTVINDDDEKTKTYKNGKTYLSQIWYGTEFEVDENLTDGKNTLNKVDAEKYEMYLRKIDIRFIDKVGDYKVYIIQNKLKDYKSFSALSFTDNTAVVFGRYTDLSDNMIAYLATHEFGHNVDFRLMNKELWKEYKEIRGITDGKVYNNNSPISGNRPQEIFAEDFRLLYGSDEAKVRAHQNTELSDPNKIPELKIFFEKLVAEM